MAWSAPMVQEHLDDSKQGARLKKASAVAVGFVDADLVWFGQRA